MFNPLSEKPTWGLVHALTRVAPAAALRLLLGALSTEPPEKVLAALQLEDRATLVALVLAMRSGSGFMNDLRGTPNVTADVAQPTLVIATKKDGAVPFAQAESLAASIPLARLVVSGADSHFIWFGTDYTLISETIREFLA